jgi:hypothetical protein
MTYKIYRNLHKNCFSVLKYNKAKKGFRLHTHVDEALLIDVTTKVSDAGRQRVLREKSKNVHAFILANDFIPIESWPDNLTPQVNADELYYNPYTTDQFINKTNGQVVRNHARVLLKNCKAYLIDETAVKHSNN